ncbi:MAG: FG-GAP repeat domain-containing protein [Kofleriaceae bacterium]
MRLVIACVLLAACTSFEPIDRGVCGNGLVEAGEDCDSDDPSCQRCAVLCSDDTDCPTSAYACGTDGTCHAPSGALGSPVAAGAFQVDDIAITDIDRDGIGDAVGVSSTSIAIRYGEAAGRLSRAESVLTPSHSSPPAIGDLDGDGATDIAVLASDGLVAYGSRFGALAPMTARSALVDTVGGNDIDLRKAFQLASFTIGAFAVDGATGFWGLVVIDFLGNFVGAAPCMSRIGTIGEAQLSMSDVDVYRVSDTDSVVSFVTEGAQPKLCVMALHKPLIGNWQITDITPANAASLARKPVLADLEADADKCPGLINTDAGAPGLRYWDGAMNAGACTLAQVASPAGTALPAAGQLSANVAVGRVPLVPAFGAFAADMVVMSDGVYAYLPGPGGGFGLLYRSERRLAGADFADLDGDAAIDGVLLAESDDDVEVLFRRPNSLVPAIPGYVVYRVDTSSRVVATKIGDYDGNGRLDLAIVEQLADYQRMLVSYGTMNYLSPAVSVGAFTEVLSLATVPFGGAEDQAAITDDLLVLQPPPPGQTSSSISLLLGSTLGTMIPFFDPRIDDDPDEAGPMVSEQDRLQLTNVVIGRFGGSTSEGPGDLLAIGVDSRDMPQSAPVLWRMPGTDTGPDSTEVPAKDTMGLADCAKDIGTGLCVREARYLAWPTSGDADVVFAIDRASPPHAVRFDPAASGTASASSLTPVVDGLGSAAIARSLRPADLDGDGAPELVVVGAPRSQGGDSVVLVCEMSGAMATSCEDRVPAVRGAAAALGAPITACIDAAPIRATYHDRESEVSAAQALVIACRDEEGSALYRVRGDEITLLARTSSKLDRVIAGDVTGDGVDDVLAVEGESGAQSLVVFPQCSSREQAACAGGGQ